MASLKYEINRKQKETFCIVHSCAFTVILQELIWIQREWTHHWILSIDFFMSSYYNNGDKINTIDNLPKFKKPTLILAD